MGRRKKEGRHRFSKIKPNDYFSAGPFEFARFGKVVMGRSRATPEQWKAMKAEMVNRLPGLVAEIDATVARIANRVARLPPDQLLQRAWWEFAALMILSDGRSSDREQSAAMRMIDYVQSVIASVQPVLPHPEQIEEADWKGLSEDVRSLFDQVTRDYQLCRTAKLQSTEPNPDMELEEFRFWAETLWMNVRGVRYQPHQAWALLDVLTPHSDELVQLFGIDASTLVGELEKILAKLTGGLNDLLTDLHRLREESIERSRRLATEAEITDLEALQDKLFEDPEFAARRDRVAGELVGLDLFDVEKVTQIPKSLLDELAWLPGEEQEFLADGEFRGWPLRIWPTMKRPFIRLGGQTLCFDLLALFDNIYRVMHGVIVRLDPAYEQSWNERQRAVSEELPFTYLERLLPGAHAVRPIYYRHKVGNGPAQWYEADGLLVYDDHLFVVEVKAGAFTYTSPATDLQAHINSLKNLVLNPATQGSRFVDYLESDPEVALFDAKHNEIGRIRRSDFRHVTICAVTLDAFTELAARANHLRTVGVDVGLRSVWSLSIDDLRVYSDLFGNPLRFLHFVEQRMLAAHSKLVDLNDEMDHLGLYVENNNYSLHAAELGVSMDAKLIFDGYRGPIDKYYAALVRGERAAPPEQEAPARLAEIVEFLAASNMKGRSKIVSFLLDAPETTERRSPA